VVVVVESKAHSATVINNRGVVAIGNSGGESTDHRKSIGKILGLAYRPRYRYNR